MLDCSHGADWVNGLSFSSLWFSVWFPIRSRAGFAVWRLAGQNKLTFGRRAGATAPGFRFRRRGSEGRVQSSLRHFKPCNPSVRPPGSAEADRASGEFLFLGLLVLPSRLSGFRQGLHDGALDDHAVVHVLPQRNEELARQGDDRGLAPTLTAALGLLVKPARQRRVRLVP